MRAERDARRAWWSANAPRWLTWPALLVALALALAVGAVMFPREGETRFVDVAAVKWRTREVTRWRTATVYTAERRVTETVDGGTRVVEEGVRELTRAESQAQRESMGQVDERRESSASRLDRYRVSLQVGASWAQPSPAIPGAGPLVFGVAADARLGNLPLWVGAWGGTYGAAGGSLSLTW